MIKDNVINIEPNTSKQNKGYTASELMQIDFPEPVWVVPNLLPQGLTLLCGKPKMGKSFLALNIALDLSSGSNVLGKIPINPIAVLYLALEDTYRRLKGRLSEMIFGASAPENLHFYTQWDKVDQGGIEQLEDWLNQHSDVKLVILDTFERFRPAQKRNLNIYSDDYAAVERLKNIADSRSIAFLVVHHLRKMESDDPLDMISGSTGLSGAADSLAILKRERGSADAFLYVTGRDVIENDYALKFDNDFCRWKIMGNAHEYKMSESRMQIIRYLTNVGQPKSAKEISEATGKNYSTIRSLLSKMVADGQLFQPEEGLYYINNVNT
jgi:hypothetical protein